MRKDDARKLDHATLEALRIRAVGMVQKGESPEVVGKALGLNRTTVYEWLAMYRRGGWDALKAKPVPGRKPKLSGKQMNGHNFKGGMTVRTVIDNTNRKATTTDQRTKTDGER
jgi:hypothetical protein